MLHIPKASSLLTSTFLLFVALPAMAGEFNVPVNTSRKITWRVYLYEDCKSMGEAVIRITLPPTHGRTEIKRGTDHTNFQEPNPRVVCNTRSVPSIQVWYIPEKDYTGPDEVSMEILSPDGKLTKQDISILVR